MNLILQTARQTLLNEGNSKMQQTEQLFLPLVSQRGAIGWVFVTRKYINCWKQWTNYTFPNKGINDGEMGLCGMQVRLCPGMIELRLCQY